MLFEQPLSSELVSTVTCYGVIDLTVHMLLTLPITCTSASAGQLPLLSDLTAPSKPCTVALTSDDLQLLLLSVSTKSELTTHA